MKRLDPATTARLGRQLRQLATLQRWRRLLLQDVPVKLLSVAVAFGLWVFVNAGERDTELALQVPLELRGLPAALMVTSPRVDFIDLRVSGPRTLLGRIDRNRLTLPLDLAGVRPGPAVFRVSVESLNLPRGVKVTRITPAQVMLDLERIARVSVPVQLRLDGDLPDWLRILKTQVSPERVELVGPASAVEEVEAVETEPLDLAGAGPGKIERELALPEISGYVSFSTSKVAAQVQIAEVESEREFRQVAVTVRNSEYRTTVDPAAIRVTVRGPKRIVESLELGAEQVYIDASGAAPGRHKRTATIDLPPGVQVVTQRPSEIQLRVSKSRKK